MSKRKKSWEIFIVLLIALICPGLLSSVFAQSLFYEQFSRFDILPRHLYSPAEAEADQTSFYSWSYPRTEPFPPHYRDYGLFLRPINSGPSGDENVYMSDVENRMETEGVANLGERQFFTDSNGTELPYFILTPPDYDPGDTETTYPLLLVIHGAGGVGGTTPTWESKFMALDENRQAFPAFVISPTFPGRPVDYAQEGDPNNELKTTEYFDAFMELVDGTIAAERIDTNRVYATGFSMGGATTWTILFERPDLLSAAAPFAGGPGGTDLTRTVAQAALFKDTAIWAGIGTHDFIGASWGSMGALNYRMMYDKVRQAGHGAIRLWEVTDLDHQTTVHYRRLLATVDWMFAHQKGQDIPPGFMHIPHDARVDSNSSIRFEGYACGRPEATHYEWKIDGMTLTGEDGPVLELSGLTTADAGKYTVTAFYPEGSSITSSVGRLEVLAPRPPVVVASPEGAHAYTGEERVFTVQVEGTAPISYTWEHDGAPLTAGGDIAGVDSNTLTLSNLTLASGGIYTLIATNSEGSASVSVNLNVENSPYYETQDLRAWIPDTNTLPVLRGILVNGNGAGADNMAAANNPLIQEWAFQHGFITIGTAIGNLGEILEWESFTNQLNSIATTSGRPEINHAPMLFWGHSMGGQSAYGAARGIPERMIAFDVNKGSNYVRDHGSDPWGIPALMIAGEDDTDLRRDNIRNLYREGRAEGAPWAWLEEYNEGHSLANSMQIVFAFFEEILPLRYPEDPGNVPTATNAPTLLPVDQSAGWLVETGHTAWATGYVNIESQSGFAGDPLTRGWVPTERVAQLYRALASYVTDFNLRLDNGKHFVINRPHNPLMSFDGEVAATARYAPSETLSYGFDLIGSPEWTEIRVYDYDQLIETIPVSASTRFDLELDLDHTKPSNVIHMEMDLTNGEKRTSFMIFAKSKATEPLHFVRKPRDSAALAGGTVRLMAAVGGSGPLSYQWSKEGTPIIGATAAMLEITALSAADAGSYTLQVNGPDGQTLVSDPVTVSVGEGDTVWQRINFQTDQIPAPAGWLPDLGDLYGDRGNGESYGWLEAPYGMRQRFHLNPSAPSVMHDGLAILRGARWEMAVPNGTYRVRIVAGDPEAVGNRHHLTVNGDVIYNITTTTADPWSDGAVTVRVWEGKLRIEGTQYALEPKLAFIEIDRVYRIVTETEAVITATPESGLLPLEVVFSTHRSPIKTGETIQSAAWDFGDGNNASGESVTNIFTDPGDFTVTLTLTDSSSAESVATRTISVGVPLPTLTTQPVGATIPVADPLSLSVVADGYGTLEYEWVRSGQALAGETNATLSVDSAGTDDSGSYFVRVSNAGGTVQSEAVDVAVVPAPPVPTNVTAAAQGSSQVRVSWDPAGDFMERFTVERADSESGPWTQVGTVDATFNAFTDTQRDPVTTYYYRVRAENQFWDGPYSDPVSATTDAVPGAGWTYTMAITLDGYQGQTDLDDFPVLVRFDESQDGFSFADFADAQGGDLRFVNDAGDRELPYEIDTWNDNGTAAVWVRVPFISGTTTTFRALWDNSDATNPPAYTANGTVWEGNYRAVWHLKEETGDRLDSTSFDHHASPSGPMAVQPGVVGNSARYDGSDGGTALQVGSDLPDTLRFTNRFTLEGWIRIDVGADTEKRFLYAAGDPYWDGGGYRSDFNTTRHRISIGTEIGVGGGGARITHDAELTGGVPESQWIHLAVAWDGSTMVTYIDGVSIFEEAFNHVIDYPLGPYPALVLGAGIWGDGDVLNRSLAGNLDEMRISANALPADWIAATHKNLMLTADFMTLGTPQTTAPPPVIEQQPQGLNVNVNDAAVFTVVASSDEPIGYQWQKDGVDIPGATATNFSIANAGVSDSGFYRVAVSNVNGTTMSVEAELVVNGTVPTVSEWPDASVLVYGQTLGDATLTGGAADTTGTFAFADPSFTPEVGTNDQTMVFTPDDDFNYETVSGAIPVTVNPVDATVTFSNVTVSYNGQPQSPGVVTDPAGLDVEISYDGSAIAPSNAGSYAVVATVTDPNAAGSASGSFTIAPALLTVTADDTGKFEGDPDPALTWTLTVGQLFGGDSLSGSLARESGEVVGSYSITQGTLAATANYSLSFQPGTFSIIEAGDAPWVLQSDFDALNLGALNGQGGWSG